MKKLCRKIKEIVLSIIFPKKCVFCDAMLSPSAELCVCVNCINTLPFCLAYNRCRKCGKPVEEGEKECSHCRDNKMKYCTKISAAYIYKDSVKKSILRFKDERYCSFARTFAHHMKIVAENDNKNREFDVVISVAPRKDRMRKSGYDQAECLGIELSKLMKLPFERNVLCQAERRKKQSSLSAEERCENAKGNYRVKRESVIKDKNILLVDDVCTTGSTLNECARVLKKAGANQVCCVVAATV